MRATMIPAWASLFLAPLVTLAADAAPCRVHVILFVPADVAPPSGYERRMDQIVNYTESFLRRGLERWGHRNVASPFRRSADGHAEVELMRGKEAASHYKPVTVRTEVMDALRRRGRLDGGRQIWWIMVYVGDPPAKFAGFLGGYGQQIGGWSVCQFNTAPGRIDPAEPLGSDFLESLMLKGMIHELGHAFQLPHIGPLNRDKSGNTLMGPTHHHYRRVVPTGERRVYLSEAEAAMLSTHPAFRGVPDDRGQPPKVEVRDMSYAVDSRSGTLVVRGRVRASRRAVYALVADESDARPGEYWTKTYVGKVAPDGSFAVTVSEPSKSNGTLKTWFAFENGALTGDGRGAARDGGIPRAYTYGRRGWSFN
ncbi:MAG: hypothetical protein GC206_13190 [Alphaproteobacteria bacterium]|nr:hypothetical protein [Alphaproteobacteria bacterium]